MKFHLHRHKREQSAEGSAPEPEPQGPRIDAAELAHVFASPQWLRDVGLLSWFVVGLGLVLIGFVWVLDTTSTIVEPVVAASIIAAVAAPGVASLQRRGVPRAGGAGIVLLCLLAITVIVGLLVIGGISSNSEEIRSSLSQAADKIEGWAKDAGVDDPSDAKDGTTSAVSESGSTLLQGIASGIEGLTSLAFFLSFTLFATFFLLKDGPTIKRFVDRNLGVPEAVATVITGNIIISMRRYFFGVSIVGGFNAIVVGLAAWVLGVPLAGTIAVVVFVTAYVPFIGAFVSGAFAVLLTLATEGTTDAVIMLVVVILANGALQQIVQPIAFGATLDLNPLVVLIVTIAAGSLFGMVGLILAAPLTSAALHVSRDLAAARLREAEARAGPPEPAVATAEP